MKAAGDGGLSVCHLLRARLLFNAMAVALVVVTVETEFQSGASGDFRLQALVLQPRCELGVAAGPAAAAREADSP